MKITLKQAESLINLVQETQIADFFEQLRKFGIESTEISTFQKEFMFGNYRFDFYDRLQTYVNSIAETDIAVRQPRYDIFLSFSSKNTAEAESIVVFLRKCGLSVFFSNEDLKNHAGKNFITKINEALKTARHFLLLATPNSVVSPYVHYECEEFLRIYIESRKERRIFILKGEGFTLDLLKKVDFETIQTTEKEDIVRILGKEIPKDDLAERIEDYKELFEVFYADEIITERKRKQLLRKQQDLNLTDAQVEEIENGVKGELRLEQELIAKEK
ncbi:MAG: toll/interleukin-1 receptor domain-containing protein [Bernardetiaceae bacterium]|nr:toll/interleukin-1 receptor domain-containing protein [Bernardetiaceae bacterium]